MRIGNAIKLRIGLALLIGGILLAGVLRETRPTRANVINVTAGNSIQAAIDGATTGDIIKVQSGTYDENLVINKSLTLEGGYDASFSSRSPHGSIISPTTGGLVVSVTGNDVEVTLDGFEIRGGNDYGNFGTGVHIDVGGHSVIRLSGNFIHDNTMTGGSSDHPGRGGGIGAVLAGSSVMTLTNNVIMTNTSGRIGGGVWLNLASGTTTQILSNTLASNSSVLYGGGLCAEQSGGSISITRNTVQSNTISHYGGGLYISMDNNAQLDVLTNTVRWNKSSTYDGGGTFIIMDNNAQARIWSNTFYGNQGARYGGALYVSGDRDSVAQVANNQMYQNSAYRGSGTYATMSNAASITLDENNISRNTASNQGGGLYVLLTDDAQASVLRNQVRGNQATTYGGIYANGDNRITLQLTHNTIATNATTSNVAGVYARVHLSSTLEITGNTILSNTSGNYYGGAQVIADSFCEVRFTDNLVMSNTANATTADLYGGLSYGLSNHSYGTFDHNQIRANRSGNSYGGGYINITDASSSSFSGNLVQGNSSGNDYGGLRILLDYGSILTGTTLRVEHNYAADAYGGLQAELYHLSALTFTQALSCTHNRSDGSYGGGYVRGYRNTNISIAHLYAAYNQAANLGGGFALRGDDNDVISVPQARIISNTAGGNGGGLWLYAEYGSKINLTHSLIVSNTSGGNGGGLYIDTDDHGAFVQLENTEFISNTASVNGGGASLGTTLTNGAVLGLDTTRFVSNTTQSGDGGGLHIVGAVNHAQAYANHAEFLSNRAGDQGGGVYLGTADDAGLFFNNALFQNNTATTSGGGLYSNGCRYRTEFSLMNTTMTHNTAGAQGGALFFNAAANYAHATFENNILAFNHADSTGGAFYASTLANAGAIVTFTHNSILTNTANGGGGGMYCSTLAQSGSAVIFQDNTLRDNAALDTSSSGGGAYLGSLPYAASVKMYRNNFVGNTSSGHGAGLYLSDTYNASRFDFRDNTVMSNTISNTTPYNGGGFYLYQIRLGSLITMSNNLFQANNASGDGGGLYVASGFNNGALAHFRQNTWQDNVAGGNGGGIYLAHVSNGSRMTFADSQVSRNTAAGDYGGSYFGDVDHSNLDFSRNAVTSNHAGLSGTTTTGGNYGGFCLGAIKNGGSVAFSYNQILSNTAHANGVTGGDYGGLYIGLNNKGLLRMQENAIVSNVAQHDHAGMVATLKLDSRLLMTHNVITANQAAGLGGGLTLVGEDASSSAFSQYFLFRNQIVANSASERGGLSILDTVDAAEPLWGRSENNLIADNSNCGIFLANVDFHSTNDTIANNTGAGVYVSGTVTSTINVINSVFWGNADLYAHAAGVGTSQMLASYSDLQDTDPTYPPGVVDNGHNLCAEPSFTSPTTHDYHPKLTSWLRNSGSDAAAPPIDLDNVPRPVETHPTIGAYEYRVGGVMIHNGDIKSSRPGTWITHTVIVTNTGSGQDEFIISLNGNQWPAYITHPGETLQLSSLILDPGAAATLWVYVQVPADANAGARDTGQVIAASQRNAFVVGSVNVETEAALASALSLSPDSRAATPAKHTQVYLHVLQNLGNGEDTFNLSTANSLGWVATVRPANVTLAQGASAIVTVSVQVLDDVGQTNVTTITATSLDGTATALAHDQTTAVPRSTIAFLTVEPSRGATASAGTSHVYPHTLTNRATQPDTVTLAALSGFGWPVAVSPTRVSLSSLASTTVSLTVTLPLTAPRDAIELTTLIATSESDPNVQATLQDATTVLRPSALSLSGNEQQSVAVGAAHVYTHTLTNHSPLADEVTLSAVSSLGWPVTITPTQVSLPTGASCGITVTVSVPSDAFHGQTEHTTVVALSGNDSRTAQQDDINVVQRPFALFLTPDHAATVPVEANDITHVYTHTLRNNGSSSDAVALSVSSSQGWPVSVSPASLTLAGESSALVTVTVTVPGGTATGETDFAQVSATSGNDGRSAVALDVTTAQQPAKLSLSQADPASALVGTVLTYRHTVTNTGSLADHVSFAAVSSQGWAVTVAPSALDLPAGAHAPITVTVTLPADGSNGLVDVTQLQATSQNAAQLAAVAVDVTTLLNPASLVLASDQSQNVAAKHTAIYTHTLTNHGARMDTFLLSAVSARDWPVTVSPAYITLAPNSSAPLTLTVSVPGVSSGTREVITVTATSSYGSSARVSNTDVAVVSSGQSSLYLPLILRNGG